MEQSRRKAELPPIPAKRYFTIGEVSELCGVKPHVLRYWEQEFTQLKPVKRRGNRRYYQQHEVLLIRRIRELLYEEAFTISGARNRLDHTLSGEERPDAVARPSRGAAANGASSGGADLAARFEAASEPGLCWGDPRPGNIIWRDVQPVCATDFEAASIAPPELDVGWWLMFDRTMHEGAGGERLGGDPSREDRADQAREDDGRSDRVRIDHVLGHRGGHLERDKGADEVEQRRHRHSEPRRHRPGRDRGGDDVGRVVKPVGEVEGERRRDDDHHDHVGVHGQLFLMTIPSTMEPEVSVASIARSSRRNMSRQRITTIGSIRSANSEATASR